MASDETALGRLGALPLFLALIAGICCPAHSQAPDEQPPWAGSSEARTDQVLKPWTPVVADRDSITCWDRKYVWDLLPFPSQVFTGGEALLAGPVRLRVTVGGEELQWKSTGESAPAARISTTGSAARIARTAAGGAVLLDGAATVEFDGMARIDFSLAASHDPVRVDSFIIEIPLRPQWAKLYHFWPMHDNLSPPRIENSGLLKQMASDFRPLWWLGNEQGGMCWFAESNLGWSPVASPRATEIVPAQREVVLRLRVWDQPHTLRARESFTMGLMATPVKPWLKDWHKQHISGNVSYAADESWLDAQKKLGVTILQWGSDWSEAQAGILPLRPDQFRRINEAARQRGMRIVPYFGFEISDLHPGYPKYQQHVRVSPFSHKFTVTADYSSFMPPQTAYAVCYRSHWAEFIIEGMARLKRECAFDGVYLDGTASPWPCANRAHGCGYIATDGTIRPTYPIFAVRDLMKRIRTLFPEEGGGLVLVHNSSCMMMPTLSFATCYMDGEYLANLPREHPLRTLPLAAFRAEFMGHNWGIPHMMLPDGNTITEKEMLAIALLHGVIPRSDLSLSGTERVSRYKRAFQSFGVDEAEWHPDWRNEQYVSTSHPEQMKVSCYRNGGGNFLLIVSNLAEEDLESAWVKLDPSGESEAKISSASDALSGEPLVVRDGKVQVQLPKFDPRLILAH